MNIAVYVTSSSKNNGSNFIVETFFPLFEQFTQHRVILIADVNSEFGASVNCEKIRIKRQPKNFLLKKIWIERTLAGLLKKIKADIFISTDSFCSLNISLPQYILMPDPERMKLVYAKKAQLLIVTSESTKKELIGKLKIPEEKIAIVYPPPAEKYLSAAVEERELIKAKYSEGKEYFLYCGRFPKQENLIDLLKSFSHFKKRQQSGFKLLIIGKQNTSLVKNTENYKYRGDVVFLSSDSIREKAGIMAAAYALILPYDTDENITYAFGAMKSGVPVITTKDSSTGEIAGDAVLYADNDIKDIGEKMMQLYKDEIMRSQLMEKGKRVVENFTIEKVANQLWQSITKGPN